jgi:hypothetical protein
MFAETRERALSIGNDLANDSLIGPQGILYRKYVPLKTYEIGINGLPFTNEWRFFFYKRNMLSFGYYWTLADDKDKAGMDGAGMRLAQTVADIACTHVSFFAVDIAQKEDGDWILIELNDGQQAGLSFNDPNLLYSNLSHYLEKEHEDARPTVSQR